MKTIIDTLGLFLGLLIALAIIMAGLLLYPSPGAASPQCGPRDSVLAQLATRYDEDRRGAGMAANGMMVELFASASGSWTFTVTTPQGQTCLLASGQNWEALPPVPKGTEG